MVDWDFIREREGFTTKGYVPDPDNSQSGVTIASGFDLGQRQAHAIESMGLGHLVPIFAPYFGLKGREALKVLTARPLSISVADAEALTERAHARTLERLRADWAGESHIPWFTLTTPQQTVLASVTFQYGSLKRKTPKFWSYAITGQWDKVVKELRNFGDRYSTRRNLEADYLEGK